MAAAAIASKSAVATVTGAAANAALPSAGDAKSHGGGSGSGASSSASGEEEPACVAILDAGAQYGKVIDRRVRECCVRSDILPLSATPEQLKPYRAIIVSGGPQSVYDKAAPKFDAAILSLGKPVLGICYGLQLINHVNGGAVGKQSVREDGHFAVAIAQSPAVSPLFAGLPPSIHVLLTHGDSVTALAPGYRQTATSAHSGLVAAIEHCTLPIYAVQFHPEVGVAPHNHGLAILRNFLFPIAKLQPRYTPLSRQLCAMQAIRQAVGPTNAVLLMISGGVDSTVCAALVKAALEPPAATAATAAAPKAAAEALASSAATAAAASSSASSSSSSSAAPAKSRVYALHIDNGFMRQRESAFVAEAMAKLGVRLTVVDASAQFYAATTVVGGARTERLDDTISPEIKRKIIGDTFVHVAQAAMLELGLDPDHVFLAQGTLRPDLIESASHLASSNAEVIKTHHNDTELVRALRRAGRVIEPLRDYHKDEVRALGLELGLPHELVWRQPFPGPGLAVRILCAQGPVYPPQPLTVAAELRAYATAAIDARVLPIRTVGVQGDCRSYSALVALSLRANAPTAATAVAPAKAPPAAATAAVDAKAVTPADGKTAGPSASAVPWDDLFRIALNIPKRVHGVNRVVYVFGPPLPEATKPLTDAEAAALSSAAAAAASSSASAADAKATATSAPVKADCTASSATPSAAAAACDDASVITPTRLTPDVIAQLQAADAVVNSVLLKYQLTTHTLSQVPVILFPVPFGGGAGQRSVAIRTFITDDFMTGLPAVPGTHIPFDAIDEMVAGVLKVPGVARVCYDLTAKPPATTEWE